MRPLLALVPLLLCACGGGDDNPPKVVPTPRQVSIQVEVYDPKTNFVWEGVGVAVLEGDMEWSRCVCPNPAPKWFYTDKYGTTLLSASLLGAAEVGFQEDEYGRAVLGPYADEDEAFVLLEIGAPGFKSVFVEVPVSFSDPNVFVQVPFPG